MASYNGLPPVGYEMEPEEKDHEFRIEFFLEAFRVYIAQTVDYRDLLLFKYFTLDERRKFRNLAKKADNADVTDRMVETILWMKDKPDRYSSLVRLFETEVENEKVVRLLKGEMMPSNSDYQTKKIQKVMKTICDTLVVSDIIQSLEHHKLIVHREKESLLNIERNCSKIDAALDLLLILPNRQECWYSKFIFCLIESGFEYLAEKIDSDLYQKSLKYKEKKNIQNSDRLSTEDQNELHELCKDCEYAMDTRHTKILTRHLPDIVDRVNPQQLLMHLPCLSQYSKEEIETAQNSLSRGYAAQILHNHLIRRPDGFQQFVFALRHPSVGCTELADRLDPDHLIGSFPEEILRMDENSISLYKKALMEGKQAINTIRVMIVGHCGVGKTTLTKRLFGETVDVNEDIASTDGIDVHIKRCKIRLTDANWLPVNKESYQETFCNRFASMISEFSKNSGLQQSGTDVKSSAKEINLDKACNITSDKTSIKKQKQAVDSKQQKGE
ncbi:uncharacterized protein LOC128554064 [Mercenaria mercenaria]|uniref:uncharacterized protein LOC128554064 n=1 Tax=Mercenaria mercenaria TaxID=6596 RepID=UPI00234EAA22|nr:uncharacterized protein LOC128554064 [Mercenaria mercenaria]